MFDMLHLCQRPVTAHGCSRCPLWQPCAATGCWHHSVVGTMTPWAHALRVSFVCSKAWVVCSCCICWHCCNVLQHLSKFVAAIAVTARLKFVRQGRVYIWCCGEGVGGGQTNLDLGCSGRQSWNLPALYLCLTRSIFGTGGPRGSLFQDELLQVVRNGSYFNVR